MYLFHKSSSFLLASLLSIESFYIQLVASNFMTWMPKTFLASYKPLLGWLITSINLFLLDKIWWSKIRKCLDFLELTTQWVCRMWGWANAPLKEAGVRMEAKLPSSAVLMSLVERTSKPEGHCAAWGQSLWAPQYFWHLLKHCPSPTVHPCECRRCKSI